MDVSGGNLTRQAMHSKRKLFAPLVFLWGQRPAEEKRNVREGEREGRRVSVSNVCMNQEHSMQVKWLSSNQNQGGVTHQKLSLPLPPSLPLSLSLSLSPEELLPSFLLQQNQM